MGQGNSVFSYQHFTESACLSRAQAVTSGVVGEPPKGKESSTLPYQQLTESMSLSVAQEGTFGVGGDPPRATEVHPCLTNNSLSLCACPEPKMEILGWVVGPQGLRQICLLLPATQ